MLIRKLTYSQNKKRLNIREIMWRKDNKKIKNKIKKAAVNEWYKYAKV